MDKYDLAFQQFGTGSEQDDKYDVAFGKYANKSPSYKAGRSANSSLQGLVAAINGPLFGFADEALGALGAPLKSLVNGQSLGDNYREGRDNYRGMIDARTEEAPWTTGATQLMTSAPLGTLKLFGSGGSLATGLAAQTGRATGTGAVYGGISGAGNSTAESVGGVAADAGKGALFGGVLSGAATPVSRVLGAATGNVAQRYSNLFAGNHAQQKVAEALVRDGRGSVVQSGASNPVLQAQARLGKLGDSAVVADAGGQNTRALLDTMATLPGKSKDAAERLIRSRQTGSAARLINAADVALGTNGARLAGTIDDFVASRAVASEPLYSQLGQAVVAQPSQRLQSVIAAADTLGATKLGQQMATAREMPYTLDLSRPAGWSMRDLDHVKQGMDQLISKQWDAANGKLTPLGSSFQQLKDKMVMELDAATANPQTGLSLYKSARDAYAGPSALIDAARAGQTSISKNEAAITRTTGVMSDSEKEAFKVGAFEALREKLGRSDGGRTEVMNMWKNPATRDRLKSLFGDEFAFRSFAATAAKEARLKGIEQVGRGSQTASRQFAAGDLDTAVLSEASSLAGSVASASPAGILASGSQLWNRVKTPERVRDQIGRILLSGGRDGQSELQTIAEITRQMNQSRAAQAGGLGLLGGKFGSDIGSGLLGN